MQHDAKLSCCRCWLLSATTVGWERFGVEKRISPLAAHDKTVSSFGRNDGRAFGYGKGQAKATTKATAMALGTSKNIRRRCAVAGERLESDQSHDTLRTLSFG